MTSCRRAFAPSLFIAALPVILSACGGGSDSEQSATGDAASASAATAWNATDACGLTGEDRVAKALGQDVVSATLDHVKEATGTNPAMSTCTFALADGTNLTVLTRLSPVPDVTEQSLEDARTLGGAVPPAEDVPGVGQHAFWFADVKTMQVFYDDRRSASLSIIGPAGGMDPKDALVAVASLL